MPFRTRSTAIAAPTAPKLKVRSAKSMATGLLRQAITCPATRIAIASPEVLQRKATGGEPDAAARTGYKAAGAAAPRAAEVAPARRALAVREGARRSRGPAVEAAGAARAVEADAVEEEPEDPPAVASPRDTAADPVDAAAEAAAEDPAAARAVATPAAGTEDPSREIDVSLGSRVRLPATLCQSAGFVSPERRARPRRSPPLPSTRRSSPLRPAAALTMTATATR